MRVGINLLAVPLKKDGVGVYAKNLIDGLVEIDKNNEYYLFLNKVNREIFNYKRKNIKLVVCRVGGSNKISRILWEQFVLPIQTSYYNLNILHSVANICPILLPCSSIVTVHDLSFIKIKNKFNFIRRIYATIFIFLSLRVSKKIITVSKHSRNDIIEFYKINPSKIEVVYNAVSKYYKVLPTEEIEERLMEKFGLKANGYFLFTGTIEPGKNIVSLIRAYSRVKNKESVFLVIVGKSSGNYYKEVNKEIEENKLQDKVFCLGYVEDKELVFLYNGAIAFVFPTLYEGFGLPVLEAMACGTPVIASNTSSLPEITQGGAILVDPCNINAVTGSMEGILNSYRLQEDMMKNGFKVAKEYSVESLAKNTLNIYKLVVTNV